VNSDDTGNDRDWLQVWPNRLAARVDLICIAGAGAGASVFRPWHKKLPGYCSMHVCQLPGRENRIDEPAIEHLPDAADRLLRAYLNQRAESRPLIVFGHSMGGVIAFELASRFIRNQVPIAAVLLSASTPPRSDNRRERPDRDQLKAMLMAFDPENQSIVENDELFASLEPTLMGDFQMLRCHKVACTGELPNVPTYLLSGASDPVVPENMVALWASHLSEPEIVPAYPGGHQFPFKQSQGLVLSLLRRILEQAKRDAANQGLSM